MNCKAVTSLLSQYLDGDVSPRQASDIQSHILSCKSCTDELERLTRAVSVLENGSDDTEQVDLYDSFRKRLAEKGTGRWASVPAFPVRKLAAVGIAAALILAGSIAGSKYGRQKVLYISDPRSEHSTFLSSIAIAADQAQEQANTESILASDSRLASHIDILSKGETLENILKTLSGRSGVSITVSSDLAFQRVYLKFEDQPISTVMSEISGLTAADWKVTTSLDGRSYELICPERVKKMASAVAEAQALSEAIELIEKIKTAISLRNPELIEEYSISNYNSLGESIRKLRHDPSAEAAPSASPFFLIDDEVISTLMAGQKYVKPYVSMNDEQKRHFRRWPFQRDRDLDKMHVEIYLENKADGSITLYFAKFDETGSGATEGSSIYYPLWGQRSTNRLTVEDIEKLYAEALSDNRNYRASWLQVNLENGVCEDVPRVRHKATYTIPEMLDMISDKTNLQVVADYYTVEKTRNRMFPKELTLGELLAILDKDYNIDWSLSDKTVLRLVHRQWPLFREMESSVALGEQLNQAIKSRGYVDFAEMETLAKLDEKKFEGAVAAVENNDIANDLRNSIDNFRLDFRFMASLSSYQHKAALSKNGLYSSKLTREQKYLAAQAAHMKLYGTTENYKPEEEKKEFTFRIIRTRSTWRKVGEMIGRQIMDDTGGITSGMGLEVAHTQHSGPDDLKNFIIIDYSGDYDCHGVFHWSEDKR